MPKTIEVLQFEKKILRPNKPDNKYIEFIQSFRKEYKELIERTIKLKLLVLEWTLECHSPREIKYNLKKLCKNSEFLENEIKAYLRLDNKKINRIWKDYSTIQHLPWLIGIDNVVQMILKKYPFPELAGLPHKAWTAERMLEYILLRFDIPLDNSESSIKIPKTDTIKNSLCKCKTKYETLDVKLQYYLEHFSNYKFYYLFMLKKEYEPSKEDKENSQKKLRYNATFFSIIFELKEYISNPEADDIIYTSFNDDGYEIMLEYICSSFYNKYRPGGEKNLDLKKEPVFIIQSQDIENILELYYKSLETVPEYHFIFFYNHDDLYDSLDMIDCSKNTINKLKDQLTCSFFKIQDIINGSVFQKKLESRKNAKKFIEEMVSSSEL